MAVNLSALAGAGQQFFDNNGVILTGGKLYSYAAGTTTPQATYTTAAGNIAHTNPIILDSAGRVATGEIWLTAGSNYKFVLYTSTNVLIATWDNITGINGTGITSNAVNVQYDPAGTGAVATTVQAKLRETVSVSDFGATGDGVTDDTAAIKKAMLYAQSQNLGLSIYGRPQTIVTFEGNKVYKVSGDNVLGLHSSLTQPVTYGIDFNGAKIIWTPSTATDALFNNMIDVNKLNIANAVIKVNNANTTPAGYFMFSNCGARTDVYWYGYSITNIKFESNANGNLAAVFKVDGVNLCSDTSVINCNFQNFQILFDCTNPEAVVWDFIDCGAIPYVNNFNFIKINCPVYWSGGLNIIGGSFISTTPGTWFKVDTPPSIVDAGNIFMDTRTEMRGAGVTVIDASTGFFRIKGASFFTGGGNSSSVDVRQRGAATVAFQDCFVFGNLSLYAYTNAELLALSTASAIYSNILYENCKFLDGNRPNITYIRKSDLAAITHRQVVDEDLITSRVDLKNPIGLKPQIVGVPNRALSQNLKTTVRYSDGYIGGALLGKSTIMYQGTGFFVGPNILISSIKVNVAAVSVGTYSEFGIAVGATTTPLIQFTNGGQGLNGYETITQRYAGLAIPQVAFAAGVVKFVAYNVATLSWVSTGALAGWADITFEPILYNQQIPPTEVPALISNGSSLIAPNTITIPAYPVEDDDTSLIINYAGTCSITLPSSALYMGRTLYIKTITNNAVVSPTANVDPLAGTGPGTAILSATAGKWAILQANATAWQVMAAN